MATTTITTTTLTSGTTTCVETTQLSKDNVPAPNLRARILLSHYTPFQKAVWLATLQIPEGSVSTYNLIALHLKSSPRAVGNALRRNPFAPAVPCYRVVATNATLGGFKGKIARRDGEGIELGNKRTLLGKEGVKFDPKGRVLGTAFAGFVKEKRG
jgi:methylated-DNA-[protein]-cysteine S-methyltransferase